MNKLYSEQDIERIARKANEMYRTGSESDDELISDSEYDLIIERLERINPKNPFLREIGYVVLNDSRKEKLPYRMASLNKLKSVDAIHKYCKNSKISLTEVVVITPKYDSISLLVSELFGNAWTRGNGIEGSRSDEHFNLVTQKLNINEFSFGEVIISNKNFARYSEDYSNPRNMVAGIINQKLPYKVRRELMSSDYIRYGLRGSKLSKSEQLDYLNSLQAIQVPYIKTTFEKLSESILLNLYLDWSVDYLIDGLVIDIEDPVLCEKLGRDDVKNNPNYAFAYKGNFEATANVVVTSIRHQISKRGKITPVLEFDYVLLSGVNISSVTAFNMGYLRDNNIGIGTEITIKRSGEVIPHIVEVVKSTIFEIPTDMGNVEWNKTNVELFVVGENDEQRIQEILNFYKTLEFDEVGYSFIKSLYLAGHTTIKSTLQVPINLLSSITGIGTSKSNKFVNQIVQLKESGVLKSTLMAASNLFPLLGQRKLVQLEHFETKPSRDEILEIKGFSDKSADVFLSGWDAFVEFQYKSNIPTTITPILPPTTFSVVFSGFRDKELETKILEKGGEMSTIIKKDTILVVRNKDATTSKITKAKKVGCVIYDLNELINFLKSKK